MEHLRRERSGRRTQGDARHRGADPGGGALTEDSLVAAIRAIVEAPARSKRIVLGIGDDAAVWQPSRSHLSVVTTDALVDGVHFDSSRMEPHAIGGRAMAANLSDVAAMGARPVLATVALGVSRAVDPAFVLACYHGMTDVAARYGTAIVGGDIVSAPALTFALTLVGEVSRARLKRRDGARAGDVLAVTGELGASRAGLEPMRRPALDVAADVRRAASAAFLAPVPRLREGRFLAGSAHVRAMMDTSDGLSTDLARLVRASGCGATIDALPIHPAAAAVAFAATDDAATYALDGGEDFALLVAVEARAFAHLSARFRTAFGAPLLAIGRVDAELGVRLRSDGSTRALESGGWDHLSRAAAPVSP